MDADLLLSLMEKEAAVSGTMTVLRGLASARRRFQELAHGESSTLFAEPVFVSGRQGSRLGSHPLLSSAWSADREKFCNTILDVARLSARFGERIKRLHLGNINFDFGFSKDSADFARAAAGHRSGRPVPRPAAAAPTSTSTPWILDMRVAELAAAFGRDALPTASELSAMKSHVARCLLEILVACPNLTHLSLAGADPKGAFQSLAGLKGLPAGFSLPRLRHLDLSGLVIPLSVLRRLLHACSGTLERLFLRGTRVVLDYHWSEATNAAGRTLIDALANLNFPRLQSLDLSSALQGVGADELQPIMSNLPAIQELYLLGMVQNGVFADEALLQERPGRRVIRTSLIDMDAASLRELREHFDGTAYPRPEEARVDVPRFATAALFKALCGGFSARAHDLVAALGISPLAYLDTVGPWVPPYFRDAVAALPEMLRADGSTVLHFLLSGEGGLGDVGKLISEWKLEPLVDVAQRAGNRRTPLHIAVGHANSKMLPRRIIMTSTVKLLLELGAKK